MQSFRVTPKLLMEPHWHLFLPLIRLITSGECFRLFHVDETFLKLFPWTIVHPALPCKNVIVNLLFHHCLLAEGFRSFYIVSLIVWLVLSVLIVLACGNVLKVGVALISIKLNNFPQYVLNPKMNIPTTQEILLFSIILCAIVLFWRNVFYHVVHWFILVCVKHMQWFFLNLVCLKRENSLLQDILQLVFVFFCSRIHRLCHYMYFLIPMLLSLRTTLHYNCHFYWICVQEELYLPHSTLQLCFTYYLLSCFPDIYWV